MTNFSKSDVNHLRRLLGYIRCEIGQSPDEMVQTVQHIAPQIGPISADAKQRIVDSYEQSKAVPKYVREAVRALEKRIQDAKGEIVDGENVSAYRLPETMLKEGK